MMRTDLSLLALRQMMVDAYRMLAECASEESEVMRFVSFVACKQTDAYADKSAILQETKTVLSR